MIDHLIAPVWAIEALLNDHFESCSDCQGDGDLCRQVLVVEKAMDNRVIPAIKVPAETGPVLVGDVVPEVVEEILRAGGQDGGPAV